MEQQQTVQESKTVISGNGFASENREIIHYVRVHNELSTNWPETTATTTTDVETDKDRSIQVSFRPKTGNDCYSFIPGEYMRGENESLVCEHQFDNALDLDCHPLTNTQLRASRTGNKLAIRTSTSYAKVVRLESDDEENYDPGQYDRVYKTTVVKRPTSNSLRKSFSFNALFKRHLRNSITFEERELQFHQQCLFAHNRYRIKHGIKPLVLNQDMCKYATEWANRLARKSTLQHRKTCKYGENLALGTGGVYTPEDAVKSWYEEIKNYDFEQPGYNPKSAHFSQVIWQESTQLGVGVVNKDNRTWIVCNYNPPGNQVSQFEENVLPPKGNHLAFRYSHKLDSYRKSGGLDREQPGTSQTAARGTQNFGEFEQTCLKTHNKFRALHGCRPMALKKELCNSADEWAKHLAQKRTLMHREDSEYGENIYMSINRDPSGEDVVNNWYDEIKFYKFSAPGFSSKTGHFTQVIWSDSVELGVGKAKVENMSIVVCIYNPPGNIINFFKQQVPPVGGTAPPPGGSAPKPAKSQEQPSTSQKSSGAAAARGTQNIDENFEVACLNAHNKFRRLHGCGPMVLKKELTNLADDWAKHLAKSRTMYHREDNDFGENIYMSINLDPTGEDVVKSWYDEIKDYKFSAPGFSSKTGHFTQLIWYDSVELGVGKAKIDNMTIVVCNYNPPGNVLNHFKQQVPPVGGTGAPPGGGKDSTVKKTKSNVKVRLSSKAPIFRESQETTYNIPGESETMDSTKPQESVTGPSIQPQESFKKVSINLKETELKPIIKQGEARILIPPATATTNIATNRANVEEDGLMKRLWTNISSCCSKKRE